MKTGILRSAPALLFTTLASAPVLASSDESSCPWGMQGCLLESPPVLEVGNDTRDNLLRLLSEQKSLPLPVQQAPADFTRSRQFWFGPHLEEWYNQSSPSSANMADEAPSPLEAQMKALGLTPESFIKQSDTHDYEGRFVSLSETSDSLFFGALLADTSLTPEQRQALVKVRLMLDGSETAQQAIDALNFPADTSAEQFRLYLSAARGFYQGDYETAQRIFTSLTQAKQLWVAETASYMLMRTALNSSTLDASGDYGEFDVRKINPEEAAEAKRLAENYLHHWPQGIYTHSATGLLRRINWYLQDWNALAKQYEQALTQASNSEELIALITENDSKLQSKDYTWNTTPFDSAPDAPLLTFTQTLRFMRSQDCDGKQPCVNAEYLAHIKPIFENAHKLPWWNYLNQMQAFIAEDYAAVLNNITPVDALPEKDILAFSNQVLYGNALMAQKQWSQAEAHWSRLLGSSHDVEQQQVLQSQLAATLVLAGKPETLFAAQSQVTSLRYRSVVLKTLASPALLRQQVMRGPNNEERAIALHTLLMGDLIAGRYGDWLEDRKLNSHLSQPVVGSAFADVDLTLFDWTGKQTEEGYFCPKLEKTIAVLNNNTTDAHALNCLGEFIRTTNAHIDLGPDIEGNGALNATLPDTFIGQPARQALYEQIITNAKAEPEDKSYALYRAVMCYSPSGYNDCGGKEVDKLKRKGWFTQLKMQYPGSPWAQKLKYYW